MVTPGNLTLTGTPDIYSYFAGWSGGGCGGTGDCELPMLADTGVTANFSSHPPLKVGTVTPQYFATLADAYAAAQTNGTVIQARITDLQESVYLNHDLGFVFQGGYDGAFANVSGYTSLRGDLTVGRGSVTLADMVIK